METDIENKGGWTCLSFSWRRFTTHRLLSHDLKGLALLCWRNDCVFLKWLFFFPPRKNKCVHYLLPWTVWAYMFFSLGLSSPSYNLKDKGYSFEESRGHVLSRWFEEGVKEAICKIGNTLSKEGRWTETPLISHIQNCFNICTHKVSPQFTPPVWRVSQISVGVRELLIVEKKKKKDTTQCDQSNIL